jgi:hypothetical protein
VPKPLAPVRIRGIEGPAGKVFQMDVDHRNVPSKQTFRVFPGEGSLINVTDYDKSLRQLTLFVREPERKFETIAALPHDDFLREEELGRLRSARGIRVIEEVQQRYGNVAARVEVTTPALPRHFLMGHDERFYFIAQLQGAAVITVEQAHRSLMPPEVRGRQHGARRQGEWFCLPLTAEEEVRVTQLLEEKHRVRSKGTSSFPERGNYLGSFERVLRLRGLGSVRFCAVKGPERALPAARFVVPRGTPHMAEQLLVDEDRQMVFALGKVTNPPRHSTLHLLAWHRVMPNREVRQVLNVGWVD